MIRLCERAKRSTVIAVGLVEHAVLDAGQDCLDHAHAQRPERMDRKGLAPGAKRHHLVHQLAGHGKGDDLDGGDHLPLLHLGILGNGGQRDRRIDRVDRVDQRLVDGEHARRLRMEIDAAGGSRLDLDIANGRAPARYARLR